jgi:hypothetical protein
MYFSVSELEFLLQAPAVFTHIRYPLKGFLNMAVADYCYNVSVTVVILKTLISIPCMNRLHGLLLLVGFSVLLTHFRMTLLLHTYFRIHNL